MNPEQDSDFSPPNGLNPSMQRQAENCIEDEGPRAEGLQGLSPEESRRVIHDLRVHQVELEMQNEELRRTQVELEILRARYFDLYDLAPVGYCTLSEQGLILEANLAAATLLGVPRVVLINQPITRFMLCEDQDIHYLHRKRLLETGQPQTYELRMLKKDGVIRWVHLEANAAQDAQGATLCHLAMSDVTERKCQEDEREVTARLIMQLSSPIDFRECISNLTASLQGWSGCEAVGIRLPAREDYPYYETRGFPASFVQAENSLCARGPDGEILRDDSGNPALDCMCGNILCGRFDATKPFFTAHGSFWSNCTTQLLASTTEADRQARTRNRCNGEGYESVALVPLRVGAQVFGLLQFNDHRPGRFTADLIAHFERMADALAIALSRRQAEDALRKSEQRYSLLFNSCNDAIFVNGMDEGRPGCFTEVNDIACERLGYTREELLRMTPQDLDAEGLEASSGRALQAIEECGQAVFEMVHLSKAGVRIPVEISTRAFESEGHRYLLSIVRDIADRKRTERALRENEHMLRESQRVAHIGSYSADLVTRTWKASPEIYLIFGIDESYPHTLDGWISFIHPDSRAELIEYHQQVEAERKRFDHDYKIVRVNDGAVRWVHGLGELELDDQSRPIRLFGTTQDVTDQRLAEEERRRLQDHMSQIQKLEALGVLVAGVAHNINNVLAAIMATASLHEMNAAGSQDREAYGTITMACKRGRDVVRSLMQFARPTLSNEGPLELHGLISEVRVLLENTTRNRILIVEAFCGEALWIHGDAGSISNAFMNLCINALDAMPGGGVLTLRTDLSEAGWATAFIEDSGEGMTPEILARVMEPFFTTKPVGKGTGLGLSMTHGVIKAHGGTLEIRSQPGRGTTVKLRIPRIPAPTSQEFPAQLPNSELRRVLLVDDDPDIRFLVTRMLRSGGLMVEAVAGGEEALQSLGSGVIPDLIILDQNMPGMDGVQTLGKIRELHPEVPILISSGQPDIDEWPCFQQPNVAIISKPFDMAEIQTKLARVSAAFKPRP